ncbi:MAG TPA: hypothetical protein PLV13_09405 [Ilumatobacteraceae bacterium]|nr:hypothetical protein [Ilumatobacteraceae bacterium]
MKLLRVASIALLASISCFATTAHADPAGALAVRRQPGAILVPYLGDVDMGTTGVGQTTEIVLVVGNEGDAELEITSVTVSSGFNIESSVTGPLFPGYTKALRISCDASSATPGSDPKIGTVGITSTDPTHTDFVVHVLCKVVDGADNGTLEVTDYQGNTVPQGGVLSMDPGESRPVWLYNGGDGQQALTLLPVVVQPAGPITGQYEDTNVLAHGGLPSYFTLSCMNAQEQAITGAFQISIPVQETESSYTFTLNCGDVAVEAGTDAEFPHTGPVGAAWSGAIAIVLMGAGWAFVTVSRRRGVVVR